MPKETKELTYEPEQLDKELEKDLSIHDKTIYPSLLRQIDTEYRLGWQFMKPKIDEWALRLKLYNNQKRDKEAVGDPLMFTILQTVLASLYSDRLDAEFGGYERGDEEIADNLNSLSKYDRVDMEKDKFDYAWDWDAAFFGRSLALFYDFDRKTKTPIPENVDMMTWIRDPRATSVNGDRRGRGAMRFGGREIRLTTEQMEDMGGVYFDFENLKGDSSDSQSLLDQNSRQRTEAQGLQDTTNFENLNGNNETHRILEWFTHWNGRKVLVGVANQGKTGKKIVRISDLGHFKEKWGIIDRVIYPMAHDWDGVSIPDLVEDKQRARSVIQNLGLKSAKASLYTRYVFNTTKVKNRNDLNFDFNKHIPVDGDVNGAVMPVQNIGVGQSADWIMNVLDVASQKSTATPDIQQGSVGDTKRTATELNIVNNKVDTRYSLSAKIFGWSEKRFWEQWYQLYKNHFTEGIDEKMIRVVGTLGATPRKLTRENIIMNTDPDIYVESKVIADSQKMEQLQNFRAYIQNVLAIDPQANKRFALKRLGRLSGVSKEEIDAILPPNVDELTAEDENNTLDKGSIVEVSPTDDDIIHIEIHNKAADTPDKYAHMQAHKRNMLLKKEKPELFPQTQMMPQVGDMQMNPMQSSGQGVPQMPQMPNA